MPAKEISLLDPSKRTLGKCCIDPLRPPHLSVLGVPAYCLPLWFWQDETVAVVKKYKAISQDVLDYPSTMSMYEKESLAAEAKLRARKPSRDGSDMNETKAAIEKLQRIQELWRELGRTASSSPEYQPLIAQIRVLSAEYQTLVDAVKKPIAK
jgi:hypothetical protein